MSENKPWWWPTLINDTHIKRLRKDYPETPELSDEELLDYFEDGKEIGQFSTTWEHTGDAYGEYRELARAFLKLVDETSKVPADFI